MSRRRKGRRRRKRSTDVYQPRSRLPLGEKFVFKTRYFTANLSLTTGAIGGNAATSVFRANSLYDPFLSGLGHQPLGFDQIMPFYDHYCVIGAKIKVVFTNESEFRSPHIGVTLKDKPDVESDLRVIIENGQGAYGQLQGENGSGQKALTASYSAKRMFGGNPLANEDIKGQQGTNPTDGAYFHIWVASDSLVLPVTVDYTVQIEYTAILTEPKQLQLS